ADLRGLEHLTDLSPTEVDLLVHRLEHALQGLLDFLDRLVDHRVVPDVDTLARGAFGRLALRTHVVPDHDRVGRRGEVDVALGDTTHTAVDDVELHLVADVDLHQGRFERLDGTRVVALDDQVEGVGLLQRGVQVLQADTLAPGGVLGVADPSLAALGDLPGHPVLLDDEERVTGPRHRCAADDLDRPRRLRLGDVPVVLVHHASHSTVGVARDDRVAHSQGSALHQHRGHRTAAAVEVRLDGHPLGLHVRVRPEVQRRVGGQHDRLEQPVDVRALLGRDVDEHRVAAVLLGHQAVLGELLANLRRVRARDVDLVDRDHDGRLGGLRVVDRLHRLRHHTVVGRDHDHGGVGGLRTTGTHGGERLVTRGVDEGDQPLFAVDLRLDLVGTDVLGDATGLGLTDLRLPDGVQQPGLTVVDVTHDGHHRRPGPQVLLATGVRTEVDVERLEQLAVLLLGADHLDVVVHLRAEQFQHVLGDRLRRGDHLTEVEEHLHQGARVRVDLLREVGQRRTTRQPDGLAVALRQTHAADRRRLHGLHVLLALLPLRLTALARGTARTPEGTGRSTTTTGTTPAATETTAATGTATEAAATTARSTAETAAGTRSSTTTTGAAAATGTTATPTGAA